LGITVIGFIGIVIFYFRASLDFDLFRDEFNDVRPHEAIEMKRSGEIYQASKRRMPKRIETYDYPDHFLVRRVSSV
jgi:hypothetical protein